MKISSNFFRAVGALSLVAAGFSGVSPALAVPGEPTPTSSFSTGTCALDTIRYDSFGRIWVGNLRNGTMLCLPGDLNVFKFSGGSWSLDDRIVDPGHEGYRTFDFGPDGTLYGYTGSRGKIRAVLFNDDGTIKTKKQYSLHKKRTIGFIATTSANRLYIMSPGLVEEYRLPLKKNSSKNKPIRTIKGNWDNYDENPVLGAGPDGTVYVVKNTYENNNPVLAFSPSQSGSAAASRSIVIDTSVSLSGNVIDISTTSSGGLAVLYSEKACDGGIALFANNANGASVTPSTWYPLGGLRTSLDFAASGVMSVAAYTETRVALNVANFFESMCAPRPDNRC